MEILAPGCTLHTLLEKLEKIVQQRLTQNLVFVVSQNILSLEYISKEQILSLYDAVDPQCISVDIGTPLSKPFYITFCISVTKSLKLP